MNQEIEEVKDNDKKKGKNKNINVISLVSGRVDLVHTRIVAH